MDRLSQDLPDHFSIRISFSYAFSWFMMCISLVVISLIFSCSSILNIFYWWTNILILVSLTWSVPSWRVSSLSQIYLAKSHEIILSYSLLLKAQVRRYLALAFIYTLALCWLSIGFYAPIWLLLEEVDQDQWPLEAQVVPWLEHNLYSFWSPTYLNLWTQ